MSNIFDEALEQLKSLSKMWFELNVVHDTFEIPIQALEQAQKQEKEHIEYSKKVQEQFSNDTKRIGELESKLIIQDKLLELYKELITVKGKMLSCCEFPYEDDYIDLEEIATDLEQQIKDLENND